MFAAALIVFRESLEAALFIGIVAAATRQLVGRTRWLSAGVGIGVLGAIALALMAQHISAWFDGVGQDVVNIGILTIALAMLLWHCIWVTTHTREMVSDARQLGASVQHGDRRPWALLVAVALTKSTVSASTPATAVLASCAVGLAAGGLAGYLIYAGLSRIPVRHLFAATNVLIALLAGSIASQLARSLTQAGFIDIWTGTLWDSSAALADDSALGTTLHALVGYDAQPSGVQLAFYLTVLVFIYASTRMLSRQAASR